VKKTFYSLRKAQVPQEQANNRLFLRRGSKEALPWRSPPATPQGGRLLTALKIGKQKAVNNLFTARCHIY